eukprot:s5014_g3.t1
MQASNDDIGTLLQCQLHVVLVCSPNCLNESEHSRDMAERRNGALEKLKVAFELVPKLVREFQLAQSYCAGSPRPCKKCRQGVLGDFLSEHQAAFTNTSFSRSSSPFENFALRAAKIHFWPLLRHLYRDLLAVKGLTRPWMSSEAS